ncbi:FAD-dependent oxidoreductase [Paenibacillus sp. UMB4589-SE434]|uniref:flavin monoamine oxidase family protein n=1 Tax=Paenibacillus sp. UMB4589-SE434 TaxID=3046314 RepID=UPI00254A3663|nr:FAD-dependent oxidoreductase [Paenibacillus sp. UMB4589-SE434]MDK8182403.1 FAD-dependent oxidoreductase [Paenibacillus sp. UMB4589-SE434]
MARATYDQEIAIIGAGISGMTIAHELAQKGYTRITILEQEDRVGGKCHSIEYKSKTYEMGTLIGLPSYKHTQELMAEYGLTDKGPLLERGFFNKHGSKTSQIPLDQIEAFTEQFKRLPNLLSQYDCLKEPGFLRLPEELCQPFASWCEVHDLTVIQQVYMHYFSTFGFGSVDEVPAAYVLKFLNFDNLLSFIEITHMITWPQGANALIKRMADRIDDLRLTCSVQYMELGSDGRVRVETNQGTFYFDHVIYTSSLHHARHLLSLSPAEQQLMEQVTYERFRVYAYRVEGIPELSGYIPDNMSSDRKGHMMAWYYRWTDEENTDLITVYVMENEDMSDQQMRETVEEELRKLGGTHIRLYMIKQWEHFPHVNSAALRAGFYDQLDRLQGKQHIYYAGEIMNFPTLENCIIYAKYLVNRFF